MTDNLTPEERLEHQLLLFDQNYPETKTDVEREDIGGLEEILDQLETFSRGIEHAQLYDIMGGRPPKGAILVGPPGTGKTYIAKYLANMLDARFVDLPLTMFESKWVGESSSNLMQHLNNFKIYHSLTNQKVLVFFDEAEEVFKRRDMMGWHGPRVNVLLREMDGLGSTDGVIFGAATNHIDRVDPAILRPGRLDFTINMPEYDGKMLSCVFRAQQRYRNKKSLGDYSPFVLTQEDFDYLGNKAYEKGLVPSDVAEVYRRSIEDKVKQIVLDSKSVLDYEDFHVQLEDMERVLSAYEKSVEPKKRTIGFRVD
jgi:SpoVK/Ycf46/Vps4 family AAA+-type ATPase